MKLNIAFPANNTSIRYNLEDRLLIGALSGYRLSSEISGTMISPDFEGYIFKITGGSDAQGFPMKQGVLHDSRSRLLLKGRTVGYHPIRSRVRPGTRRRKSVRGCIVGPDVSALDLIVVKRGEKEIEGLTDKFTPATHFPHRATRIRRLFNLPSTERDLEKYLPKREYISKGGKTIVKMPTITRLVTKNRLHHKHLAQRKLDARRERSKRLYNEWLESKKAAQAEAPKEQ